MRRLPLPPRRERKWAMQLTDRANPIRPVLTLWACPHIAGAAAVPEEATPTGVPLALSVAVGTVGRLMLEHPMQGRGLQARPPRLWRLRPRVHSNSEQRRAFFG